MIRYEPLSAENADESVLDDFARTQIITEVWRRNEQGYRLINAPVVYDWSAEHKREIAREILSGRYISYAASEGGRVIGLLLLERELRANAAVIDSLHVSQSHRHKGIGRALFVLAVEAAKRAGAERLYISACPARETVAFYEAMGCTPANPVIAALAEEEPDDLQLEYRWTE